ncbi:MAG: tRNA (adenosine(37)-N6)-dimethylallyltransferase MiaA [Nitrospirota bacterium]|nr:tRNA (adenosine(37)-N6)-dimethylallyltransferase MiaA [Nitrospirota bacterium]
MSKPLVLVGPTASGKSAVALRVAKMMDAEIINADSVQVYRHLDLGTAKPPMEERKQVPHHLIDMVEPSEEFSAARFRTMALKAIDDIISRGKVPIITGGTGLYIRALCRGLFFGPSAKTEVREDLIAVEAQESGTLYRKLAEVDPEAATKIHPNDLRRVVRALEVFLSSGKKISDLQKEWEGEDTGNFILVGLAWDRKEIYRRINERVDRMLASGFVDEVRSLLDRGVSPDLKPMKSLGYLQIVEHLQGKYDLERARELIKMETRRYAKRQMTWFRKEPGILWIECRDEMAISEIADSVMHTWLDYGGR